MKEKSRGLQRQEPLGMSKASYIFVLGIYAFKLARGGLEFGTRRLRHKNIQVINYLGSSVHGVLCLAWRTLYGALVAESRERQVWSAECQSREMVAWNRASAISLQYGLYGVCAEAYFETRAYHPFQELRRGGWARAQSAKKFLVWSTALCGWSAT